MSQTSVFIIVNRSSSDGILKAVSWETLCDQLRLKLACSATEASKRLGNLGSNDLDSKWASSWDYGTFRLPLTHSSNEHTQPSSGARSFVYFHTYCVWTEKALVRLRRCAGSPEPSLVACVISTIILWAGTNNKAADQTGCAGWSASLFVHGKTILSYSLRWPWKIQGWCLRRDIEVCSFKIIIILHYLLLGYLNMTSLWLVPIIVAAILERWTATIPPM